MTPEKFIRRLRKILPDSQKASLTELLHRVEALQEFGIVGDGIDYDCHETAEGQSDTGKDWESATVREDRQRDTVLLSGDDRKSSGVSE